MILLLSLSPVELELIGFNLEGVSIGTFTFLPNNSNILV
jgi:hypothetical protein